MYQPRMEFLQKELQEQSTKMGTCLGGSNNGGVLALAGGDVRDKEP